jgi:Na+-driven multidrug efflux pump
MALGLGCTLALGLAVGRGGIARLFTQDPAVLRTLALLMPAVVSECAIEEAQP